MPALLTETIRVAPLVRKYLSKHYDTEPFRLRHQHNPYAAFLLNSLDRHPAKEAFPEYQSLTDTLTVTISQEQVRYRYWSLYFPQHKLISFNDFVRQSFLQNATREMVVRVEMGQRAVKAAQEILKRYDLEEDDLSLDTLIRYYRAYKDTINGRVKAAW